MFVSAHGNYWNYLGTLNKLIKTNLWLYYIVIVWLDKNFNSYIIIIALILLTTAVITVAKRGRMKRVRIWSKAEQRTKIMRFI